MKKKRCVKSIVRRASLAAAFNSERREDSEWWSEACSRQGKSEISKFWESASSTATCALCDDSAVWVHASIAFGSVLTFRVFVLIKTRCPHNVSLRSARVSKCFDYINLIRSCQILFVCHWTYCAGAQNITWNREGECFAPHLSHWQAECSKFYSQETCRGLCQTS